MSENERFSITTDEDNFIRIECDEEILTPYEVVGLLNNQHAENKRLKQKEIDFLEKRYAEVCYLKNKIEGLEKENEKLKSENQELRNELKFDEEMYKTFKEIIDEADDLITSHLSKHYQRKWKNFCKHSGVLDD